ncbi:MAG TPA: TonB family protein [Thermoanaerobaculia bacterium]|nr:TonB family protein [Thermoanaerobaculia bacterium]
MSREVNGVLADRSRQHGHKAEARSLLAALALHGLLLAIVLLAPRLKTPSPPLEFVPVQIIPAQALGVRRPAPPRRKTPPAPPAETPAPEEPKAEAAPPPPEPADDVPSLPDPESDKNKKKPAETKPKPPEPARPTPDKGKTSREGSGKTEEGTSGTAPGETGDQLGRRGGPQGNPLGTTAFGSEVGGLDNPDFTYAYYLDRLLSLIDAQWVRPSMGSGVKATIFFRIGRDGKMTDLQVEQSSGYNSFDLAALRAVQNAAPFPPLPRAYKHEDLGVHLIVR